jgi:hypothetical protein
VPTDPEGLSPEELEAETAVDLPDREALSIVDPGAFGGGLKLPMGLARSTEPAMDLAPLGEDETAAA